MLADLADPQNRLLLSAVSSWELAIKTGLGKLDLPEPVATWVPSRATASGVTMMTIEHDHVFRVADLPPLHRDPFDRLLIAQSLVTGATLVTADTALVAYPADIRLLPS